MRIGLDIMGGDTSPELLFEAVLTISRQIAPPVFFTIFATEQLLSLFPSNFPQIKVHLVEQVISMEDPPLLAVRRKKNSSMVKGVAALKRGEIDALISTGNTGALIASAKLLLPALSGITRPALLATLPTQKGIVSIIDVGGNISCQPHHFVENAWMGISHHKSLGLPTPTVGLLNIGTELGKGNVVVREAYQLLQKESQKGKKGAPSFYFKGNIEARELFQGIVDILVTDGFTGNILLKTTEGVASFMSHYLKQTSHLSAQFERYFDYAEYPGAIVCGVQGLIIKCHGGASAQALISGIRGAISLIGKRENKR